MNSSDNKNKLPEWQSEKMRMLIEERWSEVWEVVTARKRSSQNSARHLEDS
ncbi:MAG: hypothetical protein ACRC1Z_08905 [Waterburya sp.]